MSGEFNHKGELVFEIALVAVDETDWPVQVIIPVLGGFDFGLRCDRPWNPKEKKPGFSGGYYR